MAKVLIVEDEPEIVELLNFLLTKDGNEVYTATNGKEGLEKLGVLPSDQPAVKPDLIILDVMMPVMDGYTMQTKLSENPDTNKLPVIILTAKGQMKELFGLTTNVIAYIEKPFDPQVIRIQIKEIMKKRNIK